MDNLANTTLAQLLARDADDLATEDELATAIGVKKNTLRGWGARKCGPARTVLARQIYYKIGSLRAWIESRERSFGSSRRDRRAA